MMACALVMVVVPYLALSHAWYRSKVVAIGSGGDRFLAPARGMAVHEALGQLKQMTPHNGTLAVLPEGVMMNYLSRRESPLRLVNFMPPELIAFGERAFWTPWRVGHRTYFPGSRDTSGSGYPRFGTTASYGQQVVSWVRRVIAQRPLFPGKRREPRLGDRNSSGRSDARRLRL